MANQLSDDFIIQDGPIEISIQFPAPPSHWPWLHNGEWSTEEELAEWEKGIPRYGCDCQTFWKTWKAANPPPYGDPAKCFDWSVTAHNAVNAKLDRQIWSIEEALAHWLPE